MSSKLKNILSKYQNAEDKKKEELLQEEYEYQARENNKQWFLYFDAWVKIFGQIIIVF